MRLRDWAKINGYTYHGAYEMYKRGQMPNAYQLPSGTIIIEENKPIKSEYNVVYARSSTRDNASQLLEQQKRLETFCLAKGWVIHKSVKEIASGLNDNRKELTKILESDLPTRIIVEHKDRLTRFGFNYLKLFLNKQGIEIVVVNETKDDETDLMTDFVSIITSMVARLYGLRSKRKTEQLIKQLQEESNDS